MKNRIILFVSVLALGLNLTSCSSDDDGPSTSGEIVAKWEFYKEGAIVDGNKVLVDYVHETGCTKDNIEFKADGTYVTSYYYDGCDLDTEVGTYTKSGNTLSTNDGFDNYTSTITRLDGSTFETQETYEFEGETYIEVNVFKKVN